MALGSPPASATKPLLYLKRLMPGFPRRAAPGDGGSPLAPASSWFWAIHLELDCGHTPGVQC